MANAKTLTRAQRRKARARKRQQQKTIQYILIFMGLALLAISVFWIFRGSSPAGNLTYSPDDIVYDQPLHAIHEMEGSKLNDIPFLPKDGPQPTIAVSEDFYSFGGIGALDIVTYEFAIFNQGKAPLTISRAYTTCGCTTADFTATVIPPGKVSIMTLTLDAGYHDVRGETVRRGIIIENNDPRRPEMEVWVQAAVARE